MMIPSTLNPQTLKPSNPRTLEPSNPQTLKPSNLEPSNPQTPQCHFVVIMMTPFAPSDP
jgi:hypothetical protein